MSQPEHTSPCPTCKTAAPADGAHRPFCSARCKMVDLSKWLGGEYTIPSGDDVVDRPLPESIDL